MNRVRRPEAAGPEGRPRRILLAGLWLAAFLVIAGAALLHYPGWQPANTAGAGAPFFQRGEDKINLNEAPLEELMLLPGIGEKRARAIIGYRSENGGFHSVEELVNIPGIGPSTLDNIREYVIL